MRKVVGIACLTLGVLAYAGRVSATPVSFQGGQFDITVADLGGDVYRFVYTADFTAWDDTTSDDYITAIDFGLTGWNDVDSVTMVSETAPGNWVVVQGNGSANNCNENLSQFKICAQEDSLLLSASTEDDQIYTWTIDVAYNSIGNLSALTSMNPIMAVFYELDCKTNNRTGEVTCEPKQTGNFSLATDYGTTSSTTTTTTPTTTSTPTTSTTTTNSTDTPSGVVPEPTVMTLLGAGLMLVGRRLRRRSS